MFEIEDREECFEAVGSAVGDSKFDLGTDVKWKTGMFLKR